METSVYKLNSVIDFDPVEKISKNQVAKKIVLDNLQPYTRKIKGFEMQPYTGGSKFKNKDVLFARITPSLENGKTAQVTVLEEDEIAFGSTEFIVLRAKKDLIDEDYLYYLALSSNFRTKAINLMTGTSGRRRVKVEALRELYVSLPSLSEQKKISSHLDLYDKKIENNNKTISILDEYSQLLFYKWFVDFNFPNENGLPYKENGGILEELEGELLPINWEFKSVDSVVQKMTDTVNPQKSPENVYKYYSIPSYDDTYMYCEQLGMEIKSNKFRVTKDYLLVAKLNPWFKRIIYPMNVEEAICSTEFVVWNPISENMLEYLYVLANTPKFTKYCTQASSGTSNSHKRVSPEFMMKYKFPFNNDIVSAFNTKIKPVVQKKQLLLYENQYLKETRDLLIKKLIK